MHIADSRVAMLPASGSFRIGLGALCRRSRPAEADSLSKEDLITLDGLIEEILPDGRFRVLLENEHRIIVYTAGKMRKFRIRTLVGDRVQVEMSPYDMEKGRLVYRERVAHSGTQLRKGNRR